MAIQESQGSESIAFVHQLIAFLILGVGSLLVHTLFNTAVCISEALFWLLMVKVLSIYGMC